MDTTCLCCFTSAFLVFLALSMSSDVSRPTVELSWLNNLVCPENSWLDQSLWYFRCLVLGLPLQAPCPPPFTLPMKQVLKHAPIAEYLWNVAALAPRTQTSRCLLNVSWMNKTWFIWTGGKEIAWQLFYPILHIYKLICFVQMKLEPPAS